MSRMKITAAVTAVGIALFAGAADAKTIPERLMNDLGRDFRLQDFQAAGIVGNLARETGNFRFMQELNPIVEGSRGGIGYSQWTASRRLAFEEFAGSLENQMTYEVNYAYLREELDGEYSDVIDEVRNSKNLWEATVLFMRGYLKPQKNDNNIRVSMNYANDYLRGDFSGAGCQRHHEVTIDGRRMMISTCPDATLMVAGETVDVVLASAPRPQPRPDHIAAQVRLAAADLEGTPRPRARPALPEPAQDHHDAVREAVLVAMNAQAEAVRTIPEAVRAIPEPAEDQEDPADPLLAWDPFYARKEDEPEDYAATRDSDGSYSATV